jgi:hypothetical protein
MGEDTRAASRASPDTFNNPLTPDERKYPMLVTVVAFLAQRGFWNDYLWWLFRS